MTHHRGWFHRSGHTPGTLQWVRAKVTGHRQEPPDVNGPSHAAAPGSPVPPGPYPVGEVKGRRPVSLDDFLGVTSFTVIRGDLTYRVFGTGELDAGVVRFRQQDLGWDSRDIRSWTITAITGGIVAEPEP
jgi:hypothetical protein